MALLYAIFAICMILALAGYRRAALYLGLANLLFTLGIFWYHVTDVLKINL